MIFVYLLILLLSFYVLAKIVDDYFVASLDVLAKKLKMSHDAAGATLMAVGSSAPELFVAVFAVFRPGNHEAIGVGNIVGSALFNLLVIIGASAIVKKTVIAKQAVLRDLFFYAVSVFLLIYILFDGEITLFESLTLLAVYFIYVFVVIKWKSWFKYYNPDDDFDNNDDAEEHSPSGKNIIQKILLPLDKLIGLFFPPQKYYLSVFIISILFIAGISHFLVESAVQIAVLSGISETVIAVTILAAGTSVPDLISSLTVARKGRGGMAISNAVGSNIFDILAGLGLPFMLFVLIKNENPEINSENLRESVYFLSLSIVIVLFSFIFSGWKAGKVAGFFLLAMYFAYLLYVTIF